VGPTQPPREKEIPLLNDPDNSKPVAYVWQTIAPGMKRMRILDGWLYTTGTLKSGPEPGSLRDEDYHWSCYLVFTPDVPEAHKEAHRRLNEHMTIFESRLIRLGAEITRIEAGAKRQDDDDAMPSFRAFLALRAMRFIASLKRTV
jgi:hypothetical protein